MGWGGLYGGTQVTPEGGRCPSLGLAAQDGPATAAAGPDLLTQPVPCL